MFNFKSREEVKKKKEMRSMLTGQEFQAGNLPGTDTFDDGLVDGKLKPGSTSTESGGTYMEDEGPHMLVHTAGDGDKAHKEFAPQVNVVDDLPDDEIINAEMKGDDADAWLRANDPKYKH